MSKHVEKKAPEWHAKVATELNREAGEIIALGEEADRRRARFGLMLIWVKETGKNDGSIPHGAFGPWLEKNCPKLPRSTAGDWITQAKSALDLLRWQNSEIRNFEKPPHLLLSAKSDELKGVEKERQKKLLDVIEQQKHFRAVTRYAQVELKDDATVPKIGRRKGEGGASREQRTAYKLKLQLAELKGLKLAINNLAELAEELADDKRMGNPDAAEEFNAAFPKIENLFRYMQRVQQARKAK